MGRPWETDQIGNQSGKLFESSLHLAALAQWQRWLGQTRQPRSGLEPLAADWDTWEATADKDTDEV